MKQLSDELLVETYYQAKKLQLDIEFILLLAEELRNRSIIVK
ncbi:Sporulation inhibitor A [Lentibacillus halodurans]|uniref:Sporulation inhibitor A n=1 Tax=Lentibacillus halodurans TaxID=237679 RepID=A0A1I0X416_9BACI|nr:sporulation histidine kinase inhibitor Sda [Lentibacillus halodurans]SFA95594.1 Sporulation inhibitor A [Lentibacillus halodurans]